MRVAPFGTCVAPRGLTATIRSPDITTVASGSVLSPSRSGYTTVAPTTARIAGEPASLRTLAQAHKAADAMARLNSLRVDIVLAPMDENAPAHRVRGVQY